MPAPFVDRKKVKKATYYREFKNGQKSLPIRDIAKLMSTSHKSVIRWLKYASKHPEELKEFK